GEGATTTENKGTIPPDCTVPATVSPTEVLPATGSSSVNPMIILALLLGGIGAVMLVVTTIRRPVDS
ncbi:MAG TPA: LPXTG cell wall anchor domain-containing protein, partial [Acidimicrobiales bacterium]|nr:LPXTG cell wall anchor domain-containing protein [Acidimicrobiales bacterium]